MAAKTKSSYAEQLLEGTFIEYCNALEEEGYKLTKDLGAEFEKFSASCCLKKEGLSSTDINNGLIGGERDGGIDAIYFFANNQLINSKEEIEDITNENKSDNKSDHAVKVIFIQSKKGSAFKSEIPTKLVQSISNFFGDNSGLSNVKYSDHLESKIKFITDSILQLRVSPRKLSFEFIICSGVDGALKGHAAEVAEDLKTPFEQEYPGCNVETVIYDPQKLIDLWEFSDHCESDIVCDKTFALGSQQIMVAKTADYFKFITKDGEIREPLFDGNVRAYLGNRKEINGQILKSLEDYATDPNNTAPFWWKNNGVTVTCTSAPTKRGDNYTIEGVQIVNGLQTSHVIFEYYKNHPERLEEDSKDPNSNRIVVKVIAPENEDLQNEIIQATNSQTPVPAASLRATDDVQRSIESFFNKSEDTSLVYDRRHGAATNRGIPSNRVLQISELAQIVLSIGLLRPDGARARPGSALKDDAWYDRVFRKGTFTLDNYVWMAECWKQTSRILEENFDRANANNIIWYVLMLLGLGASKSNESKIYFTNKKTNEKELTTGSFLKLNNRKYSDAEINELSELVLSELKSSSISENQEQSKCAKTSKFKLHLLSKSLHGNSRIHAVLFPK